MSYHPSEDKYIYRDHPRQNEYSHLQQTSSVAQLAINPSSFSSHHPHDPSLHRLVSALDQNSYTGSPHQSNRAIRPVSFLSRSPPPISNSLPSRIPARLENLPANRSTLWWGDLEPWMDENYAKQVASVMNWDPVQIKFPHSNPDPLTGVEPLNPGYCFVTFNSSAHAASVLSQMSNSAVTMPNSKSPFVLNWASSNASPTYSTHLGSSAEMGNQSFQKEYSIFVGDLAPETSNSDLVAVFRNPVLGLRNDREPKFIRPFTSCKSAKIMLDPVTGVSRGYGFVRFSDEGDQQRALIEMHGLYCLSRPMRISAATAKFKAPNHLGASDEQLRIHLDHNSSAKQSSTPPPLSNASPFSARTSLDTNASLPSLSTSSSSNTVSSHVSSVDTPTGLSTLLSSMSDEELRQRYGLNEESLKHHAQARAILGNLIGPNGEQLTSTDPYNTTVFVGGLSPLISEDILRTFFQPFGDIHYVKVPIGKHCGFVQFVRKADAERAIENMQGFLIGGSRIRLSWGRSQYKAAQAAAQAAQNAAAAQYLASVPPNVPAVPTAPSTSQISSEQVIELFQKLGINPNPDRVNELLPEIRKLSSPPEITTEGQRFSRNSSPSRSSNILDPHNLNSPRPVISTDFLNTPRSQITSNFSPFSPDANTYEAHSDLSYERDYRPNVTSSLSLSALNRYTGGFVNEVRSYDGPIGPRREGVISRPTSTNNDRTADMSYDRRPFSAQDLIGGSRVWQTQSTDTPF